MAVCYSLNVRKATARVVIARVLIAVLLVANFGFIWYNSAKVSTASDKTSKRIARDVAEVVVDDYHKLSKPVQKQYVNKFNVKIRSLAHFMEFVPFGFLLFMLILSIFDFRDRRLICILSLCVGVSVLLSFLAALVDELHQLGVSGRTFQAGDIASDTLGALCGCAVASVLYSVRHIRKTR